MTFLALRFDFKWIKDCLLHQQTEEGFKRLEEIGKASNLKLYDFVEIAVNHWKDVLGDSELNNNELYKRKQELQQFNDAGEPQFNDREDNGSLGPFQADTSFNANVGAGIEEGNMDQFFNGFDDNEGAHFEP